MRVGFDATSLAQQLTGIGRYTLELLRALTRYEPDLDIVLMAHRPVDGTLARERVPMRPMLPSLQLGNRSGWMQTALPVAVARGRLDVCHYTNYHAPLLRQSPYVVNVHDISLLHGAANHPARRVMVMRPLLRTVARRADAVICLTHAAGNEVAEELDVDPARVHVIPAAAADYFQPVADPARLDAVGGRYGVKPGFLLVVGTIEPRKNLVRLVNAYATLRKRGFSESLVICGGWGWKSDDLKPEIERLGLTEAVVFTGFVPDADLVGLLSMCGAFTYPSLYEGFGLPIIEALACGAPTVTSDRGATAEVAGDAALLIDPEDTNALTEALALALFDQPTRARLRAAGLERAKHFSWERAAHETADLYRAVAANPR